MSQISKVLSLSRSKEEVAYEISGLMKKFIDDLDGIDYGFMNVDEKKESPTFKEIADLTQRSLGTVARLFDRFKTPLPEAEWYQEIRSVLFPFLHDQLEVRLRLLGRYLQRMKAVDYMTPNPDLLEMGAKIGPLTELIQDMGDEIKEEAIAKNKDDIIAQLGVIV